MFRTLRLVAASLACLFCVATTWGGVEKSGSEMQVPPTVVFRRVAEPKEHAFTMLAPKGWLVEGGTIHLNPRVAGGTETTCDITIKSDQQGSVMIRRLPRINHADGPLVPRTHGPAASYNGMAVAPMPTVTDYLLQVFHQTRPLAVNVHVLCREPLPRLAKLVRRLSEPLNQSRTSIGISPPSYEAGYIIVEYSENNRRYKDLLYTLLIDARASRALWANDVTTQMRSPSDEVLRWKPVLDIIANSVRFDPKWLNSELREHGERSEIARKALVDASGIDHDITAYRVIHTHHKMKNDQYLTRIEPKSYVNPFTGKIERDTSLWSRRWMNSSEEYVYTNDASYDPNTDPTNPRHGYRLSRVKP
jgi:hypothetical protein